MGNGTGDIEDLLERAYESEDAGEVEELVERALELDPENPEVLLLQADLTEDDDVRLPILVQAVQFLLADELQGAGKARQGM